MLLQEKMKTFKFSNNERIIIDYILEKQELIKNYSTKMIADETYTSPSTLIRISKKLGFSGWNELKEVFLQESNYLNKHFQSVNPNVPFTSDDTIMSIANKITSLHIESARDTLSLINSEDLKKAVEIINQSTEVKLFAVSNLNYVGEEFIFKLNRINKKAYINPIQGNLFHDAAMTTPNECAICISYSGETPALLNTVRFLKENKVPVIAITSLGDNSLYKLADVTLNITTREKEYTKIAGFSSLESISIVLNILYSCVFASNYNKNFNYKLSIAKQVENDRLIDNNIILESSKINKIRKSTE